MFWRLIIGIALSFLSTLFKKPPPTPQASTLSDFAVPRADEGARIFDFAGTVWRKDPHVAWYGHFGSEALREKGGKK